MRAKVILNPWADRGRAGELGQRILSACNNFGSIDMVMTDRPGQAGELATVAADAGYDPVVAAGGDGTVHEVVNGLIRGGKSLATLGVIPLGSGNDFAYGLGLLTDLESAVRTLFTGQPRSIDLARIEDDRGRFALVDNVIGIGFDATVTIQSQSITRVHGFAMYTLAALRTIALYYQTPHLKIRFDDNRVEQDTLLLTLGVGPRSGGGFFLTPDARFDDNLLDSCTVNPVGRATMLRMLPQVMKGTHIRSKHVVMRQSQYVDVKSNLPLPIHIDGEIFAYPEDNVRRVTVTSLPNALKVMNSAQRTS